MKTTTPGSKGKDRKKIKIYIYKNKNKNKSIKIVKNLPSYKINCNINTLKR